MKKLTAQQTNEALHIYNNLPLLVTRLDELELDETARSLRRGALKKLGSELAKKGNRGVWREFAAHLNRKLNP